MLIVFISVVVPSPTSNSILYGPAVLKVTVCGPSVFSEVMSPPLNVQSQVVTFPVLLSVNVMLSPSHTVKEDAVMSAAKGAAVGQVEFGLTIGAAWVLAVRL